LFCLFNSKVLAQETSTLQGEVQNEDNAPIPDAVCTLTGSLLPANGLTVNTDHLGKFSFLELTAGAYTLVCAAMGYQPVKQELNIAHSPPYIQMVLPSAIVLRTRVEVREKAAAIEQAQGSPPATLAARQVEDLPLVEQKFKASLPVLPGVVRTPDGKINIKGIPENQGLLLVNSAETVDPVTGSFSIDVPLHAIESLQVYKNAYRAEYGGFSGGLTGINTKPPASQWHFELYDLTPNPRIKSGDLVGMADYNPKLYLTGPLLPSRLNFSEALAYDIDKWPVRGLAWPHNEIKNRDFSSFTSLQYVVSPHNLVTINANVFPVRKQFANINSLVPQTASSDYGQTGFSVSLVDRYLTSAGVVFTTLFQGTEFDSYAHGQGPLDMLVTPDGWSGNFFNAFDRDSNLEELREAVRLPRLTWHGQHELTLGVGVIRRAYDGTSQSHPVRILRADGSLSEQIIFTGQGALGSSDTDVAAFAQDHWVATEQLAVDLGLRYSGQTLGAPANFSPRFGLAYSPAANGKTVLRGGAGVFHDHAPLLAGSFIQNPVRTLTDFDPQGRPLGAPLAFQYLYGSLDDQGNLAVSTLPPDITPYNLTWSAEADRELLPNMSLRASLLSSRSHDQFILKPLPNFPSGPALLLLGGGASNYREFETTLHFRPTTETEWNISYVHSRARGDLNTLTQVYVPFEQAIIRPDAYASLPSDIPHRIVTWGHFKTHVWGILANPLIDWHSGFPYSLVDERQNYVGQPNGDRFPRFFSVDLKLSKEFRLPFPWIKNHVLRGALTTFNLTNHANPRDVYNNITSPYFEHFVGFQHLFFDTTLDILY